MMRAYLVFNAALYTVFALWCTLAPASTAANIGYGQPSNSGRSEYLVVYGGLQAGLALLYCLLSTDPQRHRLGIVLSIALYAPIVAYRLTTVTWFWPVSRLTLITGSLELMLLVAALVLAAKPA